MSGPSSFTPKPSCALGALRRHPDWRRGRLDDAPRRRERDGTANSSATEDADNEAVSWSRGTGGYEPVPAVARQRLAGDLIPRPVPACGRRSRKADPLKSIGGAQVGKSEVRGKSPAPEVSRQLRHRRERQLREVAVPLGPNRGLVAGEIQGVYDGSPLPTGVRWRIRSLIRIRAASGVAIPDRLKGTGHRLHIERHAWLGSSGFVERGDEAQHFDVASLSDEVDGLLVL